MTEGNYKRLGAVCEAEDCDRQPHTRWKGGAALCNMHWLRMKRNGTLALPVHKPAVQIKTCRVDGCDSLANRTGAELCEKHYMRVRRHGDTEKKLNVIEGATEHSHGYLLDYDPSHPLARSSSRVYQHRRVFHAARGCGPFACHWCEKTVTWDDLHIDHMNDDKQDNRIENLAPSCAICNQRRGFSKMVLSSRKRGRIVTAHGLTMCVSDWSRRLGLSRAAISKRLDSGMLPENALVPERGKFGPKRTRQPDMSYEFSLTAPHHSGEKQRSEAQG